MTFVLGISDTHNAGVASINRDGIIRALQEERPRRVKNYAGLPELSIRWLLDEEGKTPEEVDLVALAGFHNAPERTRRGTIQAFRSSTAWPEQVKKVLRLY